MVLLEVGPGKTLSSLARMNPAFKATQAAIPTLRHPDEVVIDDAACCWPPEAALGGRR